MNNIFIHDAVPTWSGFLYQGRIAVYLAVKKIIELSENDKVSEIEKYALEMEKCEDIAIVYMDGNNKKYHSIHQVKNEKECTVGAYKDPLIQLMLEKGFCKKYNYGTPIAYLHISKEINIKDQSLKECVSDCTKRWKEGILKFYDELSSICNVFVGNDDLIKRLLIVLEENSKTIGINRKEYKNKFAELKQLCAVAIEALDNGETVDEQKIKDTLDGFIKYLFEKLYATEVCDDVKVYEYAAGKSYCNGADVFEAIVDLIKRYKGKDCGLIATQFEYIADMLINYVENSILERHKNMQEKRSASCEIALSEFKNLLDKSVENYEEEANILVLKRFYNDHLEKYCNICQRNNKDDCQNVICKLQRSKYRKGVLEKKEFTKFCYNLNPECNEEITNRACLGNLLNYDGMMESVFPIIKRVAEGNFIEKEDEINIKIKNQNKVAYATAISNNDGYQTVENIAQAMKKNQELIETIFDADQLITTRLSQDSSVWDASCIKVRPDDINEQNNENSIFVSKRPEFIKAEEIIKKMEEK